MRCFAAAACLMLLFGQGISKAAEVSCARTYDGEPYPKEIAAKLWPSGFRPVSGMCSWGFIRGTIVRGDFEKIRTFYGRNHRFLTTFSLLSAGGSVTEAIQIGQLFRKYLIGVDAPSGTLDGHWFILSVPSWGERVCEGPDCLCASACALLWFGAVNRGGIVGLHRPRIDDPDFAALPPGEASTVYRGALDKIAQYLREMEAPSPMVDAMVATSSSEIRWVGHDILAPRGEFEKLGLERPPSYAEWQDAVCGPVLAGEEDKIIDLRVKLDMGEVLTNDQALLLKILSAKIDQIRKCRVYLRSSSIDRMLPP